MTKETRIAKEKQRLNDLFADLDANQLQAAAGLISSAAFLRVSLEDLEAEINANGCIDEYVNGRDQYGYKVAASVQAYTALNTKYQSTMQKLLKIVPPAPKKPKPKSAEQIMAERERAERLEKYERDRRRSQAMFADFERLHPGEPQTPDTIRPFQEEWERIHANDEF